MFCINCGFEIPEGSKFCSNCGANVNPNKPVKPDFIALATEEYNNKSAWKKSFSKRIQQKEIQKIAEQMERSWKKAHMGDDVYTCPKCNSFVNKTDLNCPECGEGLEFSICPSCGREFMNKRKSKTGLCPKCKMITAGSISMGLNQMK